MKKNEREAYLEALRYGLKCAKYEHDVHSMSTEMVKPVPAYLAAIDRMKVHLEAEVERVQRENTPYSKRKSGTVVM